MKKQYTMPQMQLVMLNPSDLIATSPGLMDDLYDGNRPNLGRHRVEDWEDEEEDW